MVKRLGKLREWLLTWEGERIAYIMNINSATGAVTTRRPRFGIRPMFAWYDFWVGVFWDKKKKRLYIFPLPMLGFRVGYE